MTTGLPLFAAIAAGSTTTSSTTTTSALQLSPPNIRGVRRRRHGGGISPRGTDRKHHHPPDVLLAIPTLSEDDVVASSTTPSSSSGASSLKYHHNNNNNNNKTEFPSKTTITTTMPFVRSDTNLTTTTDVIIGSGSSSLKMWLSNQTEISNSQALFSLNAVAILWGTQHPVIKLVVDDCDPSVFSFVRFFLGAFIATTPAAIIMFARTTTRQQQQQDATASTSVSTSTTNKDGNSLSSSSSSCTIPLYLRWGIELGIWMFLGYAFQAVGLETTTAQRSGFLLYLNVKFVPFFAFIFVGRKISIPTWISALTALLGTALLALSENTNNNSGSSLLSSFHWNVGDLWSIAAAAASAMFILRLESASKAVSSSSTLNAICLWTVSVSSLVWMIISSLSTSTTTSTTISTTTIILWNNILDTLHKHPFEIFYLAGITTAFANYIQTMAQRHVSAERASIIYAMDPVYGAIFSNLILGETLNGMGMLGATFITLAAATNAFLDFGGSSSSSSHDENNNNNSSRSSGDIDDVVKNKITTSQDDDDDDEWCQ